MGNFALMSFNPFSGGFYGIAKGLMRFFEAR
jgi:hypothetical protein